MFAGSGHLGSDNGVGRTASFLVPSWLAIDQENGTLFVNDCATIRKITREGKFALFFEPTQHLLMLMNRRGDNSRWIREKWLCRREGISCEVQ